MKNRSIFVITGIIIPLCLLLSGYLKTESAKPYERSRIFNKGWKFIRDSIPGAERPDYDDSKWMVVDLPHDYSIMDLPGEEGPDQIGPFSRIIGGYGNSTGQTLGGTGWYRQSFTLDKSDAGKTAILSFDGIYMETEVWVNGKKAGIHKNGYTPFWFDITSLLNSTGGSNVIAVKVDNPGRNTRWYSGSGIYRNVHLILVNPLHVEPWGVYITTPVIRQNSALVDVAVTTRNDGEKEIQAEVTVNIKDKHGRQAGSSKSRIIIAGKSGFTSSHQIEITNPFLWSVESPDLYEAEIITKQNNKETDLYNQTFGIRSIEFSAEKGFLLNGKQVDLKGGCIHHDNGLLGSAAFNRAEERRVELMKSYGYNAIRCAHNPPSSVFLDACDHLGMLVIDEFTDMWEAYKNPQDYSRFFREWWKRDLTDMMLRDRNHPSIIMWSIGNEVLGSSDTSGLRIARQLTDRVKTLDNTRPVTEAVSEFFIPDGWKNTIPVFDIVDVSGYQYIWSYFEPDHTKHPERIMYSSESFPLDAFDSWKAAERLPYVIGDFVWTSMDYLGEVSLANSGYVPASQKTTFKIPQGFSLPAGMNVFDIMAKSPSNWPYFVAGCGDIDITGEKKPQILYRNVIWDDSKLEITVHEPIPDGYAENISGWGWPREFPEWNWKGSEGKNLQVRVFTKASHITLELNGRLIGEKDLTSDDKYIAIFDVPYQPGELKATIWENGKETFSKVLKTPGEPAAIRLIADRNILKSDRNDLAFVKIEIIDSNGNLVPHDSIPIKLSLSGCGELAASGNANPKDMASVNHPQISTFQGRAQVIIRPSGTGKIKLITESKGLKTGELTIKVTE
jgi:beta-galactosidase